jgi:hypothetical protein
MPTVLNYVGSPCRFFPFSEATPKSEKNPAQGPGCNPATGAGPLREVKRDPVGDASHSKGADYGPNDQVCWWRMDSLLV